MSQEMNEFHPSSIQFEQKWLEDTGERAVKWIKSLNEYLGIASSTYSLQENCH